MALVVRVRSGISIRDKFLRSELLSNQVYNLKKALVMPTASAKKDAKVKLPLALFGGTGNYASALYLAAVKANALDKIESELFDLVDASQKSLTFSQFSKDPSVPSDISVKAIKDICAKAKFSDVTTNSLVVLADNGRMRFVDSIENKLSELTVEHRGEVKSIGRLFITLLFCLPLPPEEEKELKESLQGIIGQEKKVKQKIDPKHTRDLVVKFEEKVFDMSIKTRASQMERFLRNPINFDNL